LFEEAVKNAFESSNYKLTSLDYKELLNGRRASVVTVAEFGSTLEISWLRIGSWPSSYVFQIFCF